MVFQRLTPALGEQGGDGREPKGGSVKQGGRWAVGEREWGEEGERRGQEGGKEAGAARSRKEAGGRDWVVASAGRRKGEQLRVGEEDLS